MVALVVVAEQQDGQRKRRRDAESPSEAATMELESDAQDEIKERSSSCNEIGGEEPTPTMQVDDDDNEVDEDVERFFTSIVVTQQQLETIGPTVEQNIERVVDFIESDLDAATVKFKEAERAQEEAKKARQQQQSPNTESPLKVTAEEEAATAENAILETPRSYQMALLEIAKKQNTIVHLGTGTGKTLIALLLIKEYAAAFRDGKQVVFLVPSVALAVQQSSTMAANLPYTVGKAYATTISHSETARAQLARSDILVATHGAFLDLLLHYGDLFHMSRVPLLILDECHNCTGNSPYVSIMKNFYHTSNNNTTDNDADNNNRPRILGLTASPLINVKKNHSDEQLGEQLAQLEGIMNAKITSIDCLGLKHDDVHKQLLDKEAEEKIVYYYCCNTGSTADAATAPPPTTETRSWPDVDSPAVSSCLHASRRKELRQFVQLYKDLGPLPLTFYIPQLVTELTPNTYLKETPQQFAAALCYLDSVVNFCQYECDNNTADANASNSSNGGRSNKLVVLEELLQQQIEDQPATDANAAVGVVFVQRRITALSLKVYFQARLKAIQAGKPWPPFAASERLDTTTTTTTTTPPIIHVDDSDGEGDQFMDADDDEGAFIDAMITNTSASATATAATTTTHTSTSQFDQFEDAEPDDDPFFSLSNSGNSITFQETIPVAPLSTTSSTSNITTEYTEAAFRRAQSQASNSCNSSRLAATSSTVPIRCGALVRHPGKIFKSILGGGDLSPDQEEECKESTIHREADIRGVINGLRSGEINVLVATSVVEEGVDVQSCSFVAVFDDLQNIKAYIQMKGRARQENAKFFVLKNASPDAFISPLSLGDAKALELRVRKFIRSKERKPQSPTSSAQLVDVSDFPGECDASERELRAVKAGVYEARDGKITMQSAKSLLYRYALRQPIDSAVRSTKEALQAHLPQFDPSNAVLSLPAYMGSNLRQFRLPSFCLCESKKERQGILALMACVRLHEHGLLTDRLLPFSRSDIRNRILAVTKQHLSTAPTQSPMLVQKKTFETMFLYELRLEGSVLEEARNTLKTEGHRLAIVTSQPLEDIPTYKHTHNEFGSLSCELGDVRTVEFSREELQLLSDFFTLLINARWKRRTRDSTFRVKDKGRDKDSLVGFYSVGCINRSGEMDWEFMKLILCESRRNADERTCAVQSLIDVDVLAKPRLWCPSYDELSVYIAYGPSGMTCDSEFPTDNGKEEIGTYNDYFEKRRSIEIPSDAPLFSCQRLWKLPSRQGYLALSGEHGESLNQRDRGAGRSPATKRIRLEDQGRDSVDGCPNLTRVHLPKLICLEAPLLANAAFALEAIILPQFLYWVERYLTAKAFVEFCTEKIPTLGSCLSKEPLANVVGMLSAKSCSDPAAILADRLEWFGDAVLQLVQTDVVLKSDDLRIWITNLHEGDLDSVRGEMCCNARLRDACKLLNIDPFIMTAKLERGNWSPAPMELYSPSAGDVVCVLGPPDKACADLIETLLGFAYKSGGYSIARQVADELHITIPWTEHPPAESTGTEVQVDALLLERVTAFTGYNHCENPRLAEEALTHPTSPTPGISSYQRLEWVGDAVLCLAVREWIYDKYPIAEAGELVSLEGPLVANETLAFLSLRTGIYKHLSHRDQTLPGRIEAYCAAVHELGKGLWSTEPPKALADVVESTLGAVHMSGGFAAGQKAALKVVEPILTFYTKSQFPIEAMVRHPKQRLLELGGNVLSLSKLRESEFAIQQQTEAGDETMMIWTQSRLAQPDENSTRLVSSVRCLGSYLVSAADLTASAAIIRSCSMVLSVLDKNNSLMERFVAARSRLLSKVSKREGVASSSKNNAD